MFGTGLGSFNALSSSLWLSNFIQINPSSNNPSRAVTSCRFLKMAAAASQFNARFRFCSLHSFKVKIYLRNQISAKYLNPRLIYYYFRFLKTNGRHIGILLPVSIFTFTSSPVYHSTSSYQTLATSYYLRHIYDVTFIAILLPLLSLVTLLNLKDRSLPPHQISARFLYPWLRYY